MYKPSVLYTYTVTAHTHHCTYTVTAHTQSLHMHSHCVHCIQLQSYIHTQYAETVYVQVSRPFFDGYCSTVQGLLDWFEVDLGFTELSFIQIDLCVLCMYRSPALYTYTVTRHIFQSCIHTQSLHTQSLHMHSHCIHSIQLESYIQPIAFGVSLNLNLQSHSPWSLFIGTWQIYTYTVTANTLQSCMHTQSLRIHSHCIHSKEPTARVTAYTPYNSSPIYLHPHCSQKKYSALYTHTVTVPCIHTQSQCPVYTHSHLFICALMQSRANINRDTVTWLQSIVSCHCTPQTYSHVTALFQRSRRLTRHVTLCLFMMKDSVSIHHLYSSRVMKTFIMKDSVSIHHCNPLQHTATHCSVSIHDERLCLYSSPPAPMNHVKYLRAGPAEMPCRNWYTANTNHFHLTDSVRWKSKTQLG